MYLFKAPPKPTPIGVAKEMQGAIAPGNRWGGGQPVKLDASGQKL